MEAVVAGGAAVPLLRDWLATLLLLVDTFEVPVDVRAVCQAVELLLVTLAVIITRWWNYLLTDYRYLVQRETAYREGDFQT